MSLIARIRYAAESGTALNLTADEARLLAALFARADEAAEDHWRTENTPASTRSAIRALESSITDLRRAD